MSLCGLLSLSSIRIRHQTYLGNYAEVKIKYGKSSRDNAAFSVHLNHVEIKISI